MRGYPVSMGFVRAAVRTPFTGRARCEFLFCLLGLPFGCMLPGAPSHFGSPGGHGQQLLRVPPGAVE
jgi:hypothetical protein